MLIMFMLDDFDMMTLIIFLPIYLQICKASNPYGELKLEIILNVHSFLTAHISPQHQTINSGSSGLFNCSTSSTTDMQIEWFHNGKIIVIGRNNDDIVNSK